jgi:probable rRNA maturation factor
MASNPMQHLIQIDWGVDARDCPEECLIRDWASGVLDRHCESVASVDIRIVDREEIRALNRNYRHQDKPTNVLSFPAELHPAVELNHLGDLVICAEILAAEASEQGKLPADHWAHLVTHGMLHLLGFDHDEDPEAQRMESEERAILAEIGIKDPYR